MKVGNITPPAYQLTQVLPSLGLTAVIRDGEGLYLDFLGRDPSTEVRIAIHAPDGQRMLAELRRAVDLLSQAVPGGTPSGPH